MGLTVAGVAAGTHFFSRVASVKYLTNRSCRGTAGPAPRQPERTARWALATAVPSGRSVFLPSNLQKGSAHPRRRRSKRLVPMVSGARRRKEGLLPVSRYKRRAAGILCGSSPRRLELFWYPQPANGQGHRSRTVGPAGVYAGQFHLKNFLPSFL